MTVKRQTFFGQLLFRWAVTSFGLWIAAGILGDNLNVENSLGVILIAALILTIINTFIKPIFVFFSLPALLVTLGLFMIVINGLMVLFASQLYSSLHVTNFWAAMLAGMIIGLVNYLVVTIVDK